MRSPWSVPFGWIYEGASWAECNERLAAVTVCEFLYWGAH